MTNELSKEDLQTLAHHASYFSEGVSPTYRNAALPSWLELFAHLFEAMSAALQKATLQRLDIIEALANGATNAACAQTLLRDKSIIQGISDQAICDLKAVLTERILGVVGTGLTNLQEAYLAAYRTVPHAYDVCDPLEPPLAAFSSSLCEGGLRDFFLTNASLSRRITAIASNWQSMVDEFMLRFGADHKSLAIFLNSPSDLVISRISHFGSDSHNRGRVVLRVLFERGASIVYKPRSLAVDISWGRLLSWLSAHGAPPSTQVPNTIGRAGYGWTEFIHPQPCINLQEVKHFYTRAGSTLALLHFLRTTDMHSGNFVAVRDTPVLIDLETSLKGESAFPLHTPSSIVLDSRIAERAVLTTGFLPAEIEINGKFFEVGGLKLGPSTLPSDTQDPAFSVADGISEPMPEPPPYSETLGVPFLRDETPQYAGGYLEQVVNGYRQMMNFLLEIRPALLASASPLEQFSNVDLRIVLRPTMIYAALLKRTTSTAHAMTNRTAEAQLRILSELPRSRIQRPIGELLESEVTALRAHDVPCFYGHSNTTQIWECGDSDRKQQFFYKKPYASLVSWISEFSYMDLERGELLIRDSFSRNTRRSLTPTRTVALTQTYGGEGFLAQTALEVATHIGEELLKHRIKSDRRSSWFGPTQERAHLGIIQDDLYGGRAGIAVFLAALYKITNAERWREEAYSLTQEIADSMVATPGLSTPSTAWGIGASTKTSGVVYALALVAHLLRNQAMADSSKDIVQSATAFTSSFPKDILSGGAGTLLAFLAVFNRHGDERALDAALNIGHHLAIGVLSKAESDESMPRGFAHGFCGIGYALARAYFASGAGIFAEAAQLALISHAIPPECGSLGSQDLRWCSGTVGMALARIGSVKILPQTEVSRIDSILNEAQSFDSAAVDTLCCGRWGRIELLITASRLLSRPHLLTRAKAIAVAALNEHQIQRFELPGEPCFNPGFFNGLAGIGYQSLRLIDSELPSVALLE